MFFIFLIGFGVATSTVVLVLFRAERLSSPTIYKGLSTLLVLIVLFLPALERSLPTYVRTTLLVATLTYGISLFLGNQLPARRRFGIAYLAFAGSTYLIAGLLGLLPSWELIEAVAWYSLVSPYPLLTVLWHGIPRSSQAAEWSEIYVLPPHTDHTLFSVIVLAVSTAAIVAAFSMTKMWRMAYRVWLTLLGIFVLSSVAYVVLGFAGWGLQEAVLPVSWTATYVLAYAMARKGRQTTDSTDG